MKVLISGATGFLGKNIVPILLNENFEVFNLSPNEYPDERVKNIKFDAFNDDITLLNGQDFDFVLHMAAYSSPKLAEEKEKTFKLNVDFTRDFLETAKTFKNLKKFMFFSTVLTYKDSDALLNENSEQEAKTDDFYTASKIEAEKVCAEFTGSIPIIILRLSNCFGPHQDYKNKPNLVPQIFLEAIRQNKITILNGDYSRDFLYAKDLSKMILELLKTDEKIDILNLASGKQTKVMEIANEAAHLLKVKVEDLKKELGKTQIQKVDISKFTDLFPTFKFTDFKEAILETSEYYLSEIKK